MTSVLCALALFLSTLDFYESVHHWRDKLMETIDLRYKVLVSPMQTVKKICPSQKESEPHVKIFFRVKCYSLLKWRSNESWESPCLTSEHRRRYPPRYYRVSLECSLNIGMSNSIYLKKIHWTFMR